MVIKEGKLCCARVLASVADSDLSVDEPDDYRASRGSSRSRGASPLRRPFLASRRTDLLGSRRSTLRRDDARNDRDWRLVGSVLQRTAVFRQTGSLSSAARPDDAAVRPERARRTDAT